MSVESSKLQIRNAVAADVPLILQFIRELAAYEKLEHAVTATADGLTKTLFGSQPRAHVVIAERDSEPVGFALYLFNYSTFLAQPGLFLEDLYVRPAFRGQGAGLDLLSHLASIAEKNDCGRMEWPVLDWNEPAIRFYTRLGAEPLSEWTYFRLTRPGIEQLASRK